MEAVTGGAAGVLNGEQLGMRAESTCDRGTINGEVVRHESPLKIPTSFCQHRADPATAAAGLTTPRKKVVQDRKGGTHGGLVRGGQRSERRGWY